MAYDASKCGVSSSRVKEPRWCGRSERETRCDLRRRGGNPVNEVPIIVAVRWGIGNARRY